LDPEDPQEELKLFSIPVWEKTEKLFFVRSPPHDGQGAGSSHSDIKKIRSNCRPQSSQTNSKIGIFKPH
jgi:hypothetical protein